MKVLQQDLAEAEREYGRVYEEYKRRLGLGEECQHLVEELFRINDKIVEAMGLRNVR